MSESATFDLQSPEINGSGYWDVLAKIQERGPVVWIESNGGYWGIMSNEMVLKVAQDYATFSSAEGVSAPPRVGPDVVPYTTPIELDPPRQRAYRKQVNPSLTVQALTGLDDRIREVADELIDSFIADGSCDLSKDFARRFPGTVFFKHIIHCRDEEFVVAERWARDITFEPPASEQWAHASNSLREWCLQTLKTHEDGAGDIVEAVAHLNDDGPTFDEQEMASGLQILVQGGIGTSASAIGVIMRVLCEDRALQERVREDLSLIPTLVEECLRLEPPAALMFRTATRDVELGGQQIKKGDKVGLFFGAANRDPAVFDDPDAVNLQRPHYRHMAFGAGVHRCIGSNLARLQIRIAVEQLVTRLNPFWVKAGCEVTYATSQARGPWSFPLEFVAAS